MSELLLTLAHLPLFFFPVKALLKSVDLSLVRVQSVSDALDAGSLFLNGVAMFTNAAFESLAVRARFELNESLLLVDSLTFLLHGLFKQLTLGICISAIISILFTLSRASWLLGLLSCVLVCFLRRYSPQLIFLELAESIGIRYNLPLDRLYVLLSLTILHPDDREDLTDLPQ